MNGKLCLFWVGIKVWTDKRKGLRIDSTKLVWLIFVRKGGSAGFPRFRGGSRRTPSDNLIYIGHNCNTTRIKLLLTTRIEYDTIKIEYIWEVDYEEEINFIY